MAENVLRIENVTMQFGGVIAVDNVNIEVNKGEIVSLIGPNGAGKTTAFNVITGVYAPSNGAVYFHGQKIVDGDLSFRRHQPDLSSGHGKGNHRPAEGWNVI